MDKIIYPPFKDCESDFCRCYIQDGVINNQPDENVCQICKEKNQISVKRGSVLVGANQVGRV